MNKNNKRGFTIVELVIVIAIIAILAAVLIPTFANVIKRANLSNDQQNVRNMNTALAIEVIPQSKFEYAGDAISALYLEGWNAGKLKTYSNNYHYAYSLENNRMYLIDEAGYVVFPEESVDKSTLWGFYSNAVEEDIDGITKYIAMDNITNANNLSALIGDSSFTIDLNGYFFGVDGTYTNLTLVNGFITKGTVSESSQEILVYEEQSITSTTAGGTYENKVFNNVVGTSNGTKANTTYKDCVFYNSSMRTDGYYTENTVFTFENCTFIGGDSKDNGAIEICDNTANDITIIIKNCTFIGTNRAINVNGINNTTGNNSVTIEGCTFNGVEKAKYAALQITSKDVSIVFNDNTINSLGNAVTVVRFHGSYNGYDSIDNLDKITFSNNTISSNIPESKYVDLDDKFTPDDFYQAALAKFKNSLK